MPGDRIKFLVLTSVDVATIAGVNTPINPLGCEGACNFIRINNVSDKAIIISYDGVEDNDFLFPDSVLEVRAQQNFQPTNNRCLFHKGQIVYIRCSAGGTGHVYLTGYYQD